VSKLSKKGREKVVDKETKAQGTNVVKMAACRLQVDIRIAMASSIEATRRNTKATVRNIFGVTKLKESIQ
jgi:hypothetical protein